MLNPNDRTYYCIYRYPYNTKYKCRYGAHKYIIVLMAYLANHDRLLLLFCPELIAANYRETRNIMHTVSGLGYTTHVDNLNVYPKSV